MSHRAHVIDEEMQECIDNCHQCHELCSAAMQYCLQKGDEYAALGHIRVLIDCAQICQSCEDFLLRGSDLHPAICEACAKVCLRCAESCLGLDSDPLMKECADSCQRCADSCTALATAQVESIASE